MNIPARIPTIKNIVELLKSEDPGLDDTKPIHRTMSGVAISLGMCQWNVIGIHISRNNFSFRLKCHLFGSSSFNSGVERDTTYERLSCIEKRNLYDALRITLHQHPFYSNETNK